MSLTDVPWAVQNGSNVTCFAAYHFPFMIEPIATPEVRRRQCIEIIHIPCVRSHSSRHTRYAAA